MSFFSSPSCVYCKTGSDRMREFIVQENDANQRVDKFIMKTMRTMPKSLMYKYIRNKKIKVNKKRCEISQRLQFGDTIQCYISEEFFEQPVSYEFLQVSDELQVVYEDSHILIVDKPIGLLAQKDKAGPQDNLCDRILHYLYNRNAYDPVQSQSFTPSPVHRIDRNTQGLTIAAKSADALRMLHTLLQEHEIAKYYLCIVEGHMSEKSGILHYYHQKDDENNKAIVSTQKQEGFKEMISYYRVLEEGKKHSLVEVEIKTGKSHQIRSSLAYLQHPLLGDVKYGAKRVDDFPYQALCAYKLRFTMHRDAGVLNYLKDKEILLKNIMLLQYFNQHCR